MGKRIQVAYIIDEYRVALNIGKDSGVRVGEKFQVFTLSEHEIIDPGTKQSLGYLEIIKGTGKITSVQDNMSILESVVKDATPVKVIRKSPFAAFAESEETITTEILPFDDPQIGDYAKLI